MATEAVQHIEGELHRAFVDRMPSAMAVAEAAAAHCLGDRAGDAPWLKAHFSVIAETALLSAHEYYLEAQRQAARAAFNSVLVPMVGERASAGELAGILADNFHSIDRFFGSLGQGRHPHIVKTFELLVCKLLACAYPGAVQSVLRGQPDFILPSIEHIRRAPAECFVFSVKKNLRDRWRQMVCDTSRPHGYYVATLDEEIPKAELFDMQAAQFYVVVTDRLKNARHDYQMSPNVITFEDFCSQHADPAIERWRSAGIVTTPRAVESRGGITPESLPPGFGPATRSGRRNAVHLNQPSLFE